MCGAASFGRSGRLAPARLGARARMRHSPKHRGADCETEPSRPSSCLGHAMQGGSDIPREHGYCFAHLPCTCCSSAPAAGSAAGAGRLRFVVRCLTYVPGAMLADVTELVGRVRGLVVLCWSSLGWWAGVGPPGQGMADEA